jgi:hypothetical protein
MVSIDVLKSQLLKIYANNGNPTGEHINQYADYAKYIFSGPSTLDYGKMRNLMCISNKKMSGNSRLSKKNMASVKFIIRIPDDYPLTNGEDLWNVASLIFNRICRFTTDSCCFPFATLISQRRFETLCFHNTIGCFLDYIVMREEEKCSNNYETIRNITSYMSDTGFSSAGTHFGLESWLEYNSTSLRDVKKLGKEMRRHYPLNTPIFDHIGMIDVVRSLDNINSDVVIEGKPEPMNMAMIGNVGRNFYVSTFCKKSKGKLMRDFIQNEIELFCSFQ